MHQVARMAHGFHGGYFTQCLTIVAACLFAPLPLLHGAERSLPHGGPPAKIPVILDTDIGDDIDDAFALALILQSPRLDLRGVTTVFGDAHTRALLVCRFLHAVGRPDVPVASGSPERSRPDFRRQLQYGLRPRFRKRPVRETAVEFLYHQLKTEPKKLTLVAVGPLTNLAELVTKHPECKPWIKRIVLMGGAVRVGYNNKPPVEVEWNIKCDIKAAQTVFRSGVPLVVGPLDATTNLKLKASQRRQLFAAHTALTWQLQALYQLWDKPTPTLFDPVAVTLCFEEEFCTMKALRLKVDNQGFTRQVKGKANARVATSIRRDKFLEWCLQRLLWTGKKGKPTSQRTKPINVSAPIARGGMPNRVHVSEDYETDIERRWWLCGKLETRNVPPGNRRACRGVLTNDFDDWMGNAAAMYTAVIFNPVPGPPMGPRTRLSFRYWLKGTNHLRVQIYSLTRGYHRCLTLTHLPQGQWQHICVDLTAARKPNGGGVPLSENERIDDIQFYADPSAELIIDDIVLFDAALPGEKRPFPKKILFTGWFDTGQQGKEWPGDFAIVAKKKPLTWKAARSVHDRKRNSPWIRLYLRGPRPLGKTTRLFFRYQLTHSDHMRVVLVNRTVKETHVIEVRGLKQGTWSETTLDFTRDSRRGDGSKGKPREDDRADEIRFLLPRTADLQIDDVLLYEPGDS
jgi:inosine-uridine nucleoside N-ribohydrolase